MGKIILLNMNYDLFKFMKSDDFVSLTLVLRMSYIKFYCFKMFKKG